MAEKITMACQGKDANSGGLSKKELRNLATDLNPVLAGRVLHLSRPILLELVCHRLCPAVRYIGATDIIKDIDSFVDPRRRLQYTYKGAPIAPSIKKLAAGTYGVVYKHSFQDVDGNPLYFATKVAKKNKLDEAIVVQKYTAALECPGIISMKIRDTPDGEAYAIMPLADGDLDRFRGLISPSQAEYIVNVIGKALICMYRQHIYYFDIKPMNILYNCDGRGILYIYLGDMGSIIPHTIDNAYSATYPPPHAKNGRVPIALEKDALSIYTYLLSCLYCQLISRAEPPVWNRAAHYLHFQDLGKLIASTRTKIGLPVDGSKDASNRFVSVLADLYKFRDPTMLPDLDKFL
jgi:hypothetical protein